MNIKNIESYREIPAYFPEKILDVYKNEFIYIDSEKLMFSEKKKSIMGRIVFKGTHYLKRPDHILNNTEAIIASNQITYLMITALLATRDGKDIYTNDFIDHIDSYYGILGNVVLREENCVYNKPIYNSEKNFIIIATMNNMRTVKNRTLLNYRIKFGEQNNFIFSSKAFILEKDIHEGEKL